MEIIQIVHCNNYDMMIFNSLTSKFVHYFIAYFMTKLTLGYSIFDIEMNETTY
jgi:hypothetical protein